MCLLFLQLKPDEGNMNPIQRYISQCRGCSQTAVNATCLMLIEKLEVCVKPTLCQYIKGCDPIPNLRCETKKDATGGEKVPWHSKEEPSIKGLQMLLLKKWKRIQKINVDVC